MSLKKLYLLVLAFVSYALPAQKYGNEWINHSHTYFKFPVYNEGIYRIDSVTLAQKFNLQGLDPKNFQVFLNGKEINIYVNGESDNAFNTDDYIEFYANRYRRDFDSLLYTGINYNPSPYLPLFNDTIYAFITYNTTASLKHFIVETDSTIANNPISPYYYQHTYFSYYSYYNPVTDIQNIAADPRYTQAEGKGFLINKGTPYLIPFGSLNVYTTSPLPCYLDMKYSGASIEDPSPLDHEVQFSFIDLNNNPVTLSDSIFKGYIPVRLTYTINNVLFGPPSGFILNSVSNPSFAAFNNQTVLHAFDFYYPKQPTLNNALFNLIDVEDAPPFNSKASLVLSNPNTGSTGNMIAYDISNGKKLPVYVLGGNARIVVPNSGGKKSVVLTAESNTIAVTQLSDVNSGLPFTEFKNFTGAKPFVIIHHPDLSSSVAQYKIYRESFSGGGYNVISADINELDDQFGHGAPRHPQSIRNFVKYLHDSLGTPPLYVLLIGKGVESQNLIPSNYQYNKLQTMGWPSSDNLLTTGITNNTDYYPEIPIGRIAATTNSEVINYLNKVQQTEITSGEQEWKKKVLHFVGGDTPFLTLALSNNMAYYANIISDTLFGGNVYSFQKNSTAPIQTVISDSIKQLIKNGASLITFFGHGSSDGFDQAIDDPTEYNNSGKYPFIVANSCYSGDIHIPGYKSISEKFLFANQEGSIGFLATTSAGYVNALHGYTAHFYEALSYLRYGEGIGDITQLTSSLTTLSLDKTTRYTALDFNLHGDPSLKVSCGNLPDYQVKNNYVRFDTKTYTDSIGINVHFKNLGKAIVDSFFVKVDRFFPNNDSASYLFHVKAPYYADSISFYVPIDFYRGIGLNQFAVKLDEFNQITESLESNNMTNGMVDLFIQGGDIYPVYPYKYAIVPLTNTITLKASTSDPFSRSTNYIFQLDTCDKFTNPIQQTMITSSGGVLEWVVNLPFQDSTVYFWRVTKDSVLPTDHYFWRESSFQTIGTKRGWAQAHFNQFKNDSYKYVKYNPLLRRFDFSNNLHAIKVRNGVYPFIGPTAINFFFDNLNLSSWGCSPDGWNFALFDSISGEPDKVVSINYPNPGAGTFSNCVCVDNQILYVYSFGQNNYCSFGNWQNDMEAFLNAIPQNKYVLGYTVGEVTPTYAQISSYSNSLYTAFESFGSGNIRTTSDSVPYVIFGKKGMSIGQAHEMIGTKRTDVLNFEDSIKTKWNNGFIMSEIIGPSSKWNSLHWQLKPYDASSGDTTVLKLIGIKQSGQRDTLATFAKDSTDVLDLYNYIDATSYPYLQLIALMKDNIHRTSPQIRKWQIIYDEAPECAINPKKGFEAINDSLQEGDMVKFRIPIENIGIKDFTDSLVVDYWLEDNDKVIHNLPSSLKHKPFIPGEVIYDTISLSSYQYVGNNAVWIDVNALNSSRYQYEQYHFNNIARLPFKVNKDITNPLLDVTFDGVRILNGDLISSKPTILITLKDENKFLALNDTSDFNVYLTYPGQSISKPVYFSQSLDFTAAQLPDNSCKILYKPQFAQDGIYQLTVQGKDRSANRSGSTEYKIQFEVKNKATVTNVMNYPNPFSTQTRFVFTLTGSEVPDVFTIQIITISGKVVREITKDELGYIHIGRNITDYAWDGKDQFGDKLANGVYLYKVITRLNDKDMEKAQSGSDQFFTKDFGKMVIMR